MAYMNPNPPAKADEKTNQELYAKAAEALGALFGTGTVEKPGFFQQDLPAGFKSRTEFVRSVIDSPGNKASFDALPRPHTNTLATVMAARGNPLYPPELVVEFVSRRPEENDDWYDDTDSRVERLGLLAQIAKLTRDPATGKSRVALKLPFNGHLEFRGSAIGIFESLSLEEMGKLGLDSLEEGQFREFSNDPGEAIAELQQRTRTPMQRFFMRVQEWAKQREIDRRERDKRHGQHGRGDDPAAALPTASVPPKPAPAPATPVFPDLAALLGGGPAPATSPRASRASRKVVATAPAVPAVPVPAILPPTPPAAEKLKPVVLTAADEDHELILAAIEAAGTPAARAMLALVRAGKKTVAEAAIWATSKGLL